VTRPPLPCRITSGTCDPDTVRRLLRLLPDWFGMEISNAEYVAAARTVPAYLAWPDETATAEGISAAQPAGVLLARRHYPWAAEIHLMAVDPAVHRRGLGRGLVTALEADLRAEGVEYLQVKTLGPTRPDPNYERTRRFYASLGFRALEEIHGLWPENPCLLMIKTL
jgi:ribosomal protein S18 acetylase RimI-like enzyme